MKNFNIVLIACLAFILMSYTCSKCDDSPYAPEQIIGKWVENSYMEVDKYGNETWTDISDNPPFYYQFNANGTFYTAYVFNDIDSSWELKGTQIYAKTTAVDSDKIIDSVFNIFSISENELIIYAESPFSNIKRIKYVKERDRPTIKTDL